MRRLSVISLMGILALTMVGCESSSQVSSVPTPSTLKVVEKQPVAQAFTKPPMLAQPSPVAIAAAPGLIQSTNANERAKQVAKGRPDPFALLPGEAVPTVVPSASPSPQVAYRLPRVLPALPKAVPPKSSSSPVVKAPVLHPATLIPVPPNNGNAGSQFNPGRGNLFPSAPTLPPAPQADLARAVTITGVIQIGNETEAIVKVPNEVTSRYVQVGQRLSNGQVLVKRIEMNQGSAPVVILEQYGIEVARAVGEEPDAPGQTTKSTNSIPIPPPPASELDQRK